MKTYLKNILFFLAGGIFVAAAGYFWNIRFGHPTSTDSPSPIPLYSTDFLVPLNRLCLSGKYFYNGFRPDGRYGTAGAPYIAFLFFIEDARTQERHFFLAAGPDERKIQSLKYLGKNIVVSSEVDGYTGWFAVKFKKKSISGDVISSIESDRIASDRPDTNASSVKYIALKHEMPLLPNDRKYFPEKECDLDWLENMTCQTFFQQLQKAIKEDNREQVARMMRYPITVTIGNNFKVEIVSEREFIDRYEQILPAERKKEIVDAEIDNIFVSWRGAMLGGFWMRNCLSPEYADLIDDF